MANYYLVTAKCGHVGKAQYYPGLFYVKAENGAEAAKIVRNMSRVKHDHKDAILSVEKIEHSDFKKGRENQRDNPYFNCHNPQEQRLFFDLIEGNLIPETRYLKERPSQEDRISKLARIQKENRKMNKHKGFSRYDLGA